jgi:hypothetical protein
VKNLQSVILVLLVTTTLSAQSYVSKIIPNFESFKTPAIVGVAVARTDSSIQFKFHSSDFSITQSGELVQPLITVLKNQSVVARQLMHASPFFPDAECKVVSFDADQNGVDDLFIVFPYGLTGEDANVEIAAAFFFFRDSSFKYVCLRSYYGDTDLFRDYNQDGRYEFACINELESGPDVYDAVNLFSIKDGIFTNISKTTVGFPVFVEETTSGPKVVRQLPPSVTGDWFLQKPDVLWGKNEALN